MKRADGDIVQESKIAAMRAGLTEWLKTPPRPWVGVMEATMFTGWISDFLQGHEASALL